MNRFMMQASTDQAVLAFAAEVTAARPAARGRHLSRPTDRANDTKSDFGLGQTGLNGARNPILTDFALRLRSVRRAEPLVS